MANVTSNLGINLDFVGKVGLDQALTDSMAKIGTALGIVIPVRTEGMSALMFSYANAIRLINNKLGTSYRVDIGSISGLRASLKANLAAIDASLASPLVLTPPVLLTPAMATMSSNGTVTGTPATFSGTTGLPVNQFLVDGQPMGSLGATTFDASAYSGRSITYRSIATGLGGTTYSVSVPVVYGVLAPGLSYVAKTGSPISVDPAGQTFTSYRYSRITSSLDPVGVVIPGQSGPSYTTTIDDAGALIKVEGMLNGAWTTIGRTSAIKAWVRSLKFRLDSTDVNSADRRYEIGEAYVISTDGVRVSGTWYASNFHPDYPPQHLQDGDSATFYHWDYVTYPSGSPVDTYLTFVADAPFEPDQVGFQRRSAEFRGLTPAGFSVAAKVAADTGTSNSVSGFRTIFTSVFSGNPFSVYGDKVVKFFDVAEPLRGPPQPGDAVIGMNSEGFSNYFANKPGAARDWKDRVSYFIVGGPHAGKNILELKRDGVIFPNGGLKVWPQGATEVTIATGWYNDQSETGIRRLKLPPGQDFSVGGQGITSLSHNTVTGEHRLDYAAAAEGWLAIDQASFVPWSDWSFRLESDTTTERLLPEIIAAFSPFKVVRYMDAMDANYGGSWFDFDNRLTAGFTPEVVAEQSNRTGSAPWVVFSYNSTPADVTKYMTLLVSLLDAPLRSKIIMECFNEPWNSGFSVYGVHAYRGALAGYGSGSGYGQPTYTAAQVPDVGYIGADDGSPRPFNQGDLFFANKGGIGYKVFRCESTCNAGTPMPSGGQTSNTHFSIVSDGQVARSRYLAVKTYEMAAAALAVSPLIKVYHNCQSAGQFSEGSAERVVMSYPKTQGGNDYPGAILAGISIAPYSGFNNPNEAAILTTTPGAARQAAMQTSMDNGVPLAIEDARRAVSNLREYAASIGRAGQMNCVVYETGDHLTIGGVAQPDQAALRIDFDAFHSSSGIKAALLRLYHGLAGLGIKVICPFTYGPNETGLGSNFINFSHAKFVGDTGGTGGGRIGADLAAAAYFNAGSS